jgi:hypothetical protein
MCNIDDRIPVAVLRQVSANPVARYFVVGLARVVGWRDGSFQFQGLNGTA